MRLIIAVEKQESTKVTTCFSYSEPPYGDCEEIKVLRTGRSQNLAVFTPIPSPAKDEGKWLLYFPPSSFLAGNLAFGEEKH